MVKTIVVLDREKKKWGFLATHGVGIRVAGEYERCLDEVRKVKPEIIVSSYDFKDNRVQPPNGFYLLKQARKQGYAGPSLVLVGREPNGEQDFLKNAVKNACESGSLPGFLPSLERAVNGKLARFGEAPGGAVLYILSGTAQREGNLVSYMVSVLNSEGEEKLETKVAFAEKLSKEFLGTHDKPGYNGDVIRAFYFPMPGQLIKFQKYPTK